ncbi:MFS transporter [Opitutus sp. ER46]|uniref:MFS transporter n=1 Tax=Opitutus sp. ER46 TaxID=2161864 RepID=UPI0013047ED4|nr:MFS transporter [Opitutus sp. ER46]
MSLTPASSSTRFSARLGLGVGALASFLGYAGIASLAVPYYQMTLGVNPVLLGVALALPRLWEAFLDPVMGNVSDNFRSRWGRRRPFIAAGAVALGALYGLIWMVPPRWSEAAKVAYFSSVSVLFFTAYTVYSVPYSALTYEFSSEHHERTRVMAHASFFHKLGELGYQWIFPLSQLALFGSAVVGIRVVGWGVGLLLLTGAGLVPALVVRERTVAPPVGAGRVRFWAGVRGALANRPFLIVAGLVLVNTVMGMLASGLDHYVLVYYLFGGDIALGSTWKAVLSSGYALIGLGAIPLVVAVSRRCGKRETLIALYALTSVGGLFKWVAFNPSHPWLIVLDPLLCGPIWVASQVLFASMLADICAEDELASGLRRAGMFGAIYSWIQKTAVSVSYLGAGVALALSGFEQSLGAAQAGSTFTSLRVLLVASTALPPLAAIALLRAYPLDARRAEATRAVLADRAARAVGAPPGGR